jgi:hypothetical protein
LVDPVDKLVKGIGEKREQGFGAVLPHPGTANSKHTETFEKREYKSNTRTARDGYDLHDQSNGVLSPSQIAAIISQRELGTDAALSYLDKQILNRPKKISDRWKQIEGKIIEILKSNDAVKTLRVWHDLAVAQNREE